jgi:hypothetical protein
MKYRKLRIAWSVAWGALCLLLLALWVRSYLQRDNLSWAGASSPNEVQVASHRGSITLVRSPYSGNLPRGLYLWAQAAVPTEGLVEPQILRKWGVGSRQVGGGIGVSMSYWLPTTLFTILAAAPWRPRRFSLRTLLIGMAVVAVLLGLIVALNRV